MWSISFFTTRLNYWFYSIATKYSRFLNVWFGVGVVVGLILMLASIVILAVNLIWIVNRPKEELVLTPMIPGVNVPTNQLAYYFLAILVSSVLHEFGHAIAGLRERVPFNGFGLFVTFMHPAAFVDFRTEFDFLNQVQQLKIYCAGAWHNVVISVFCFLFLLSLPYGMSPFYRQNEGMVITNVVEGSTLEGHVLPGDVVSMIADCNITDFNSYHQCYTYLISDEYLSKGFCASDEFIEEAGGDTSCCTSEDETSNFCFEFSYGRKTCAPAKQLVLENQLCQVDMDCSGTCLKPKLPPDTQLIRISLANGTNLAFLGPATHLFYSLDVSNYQPRLFFFFLSPRIPLMISKFLQYVLSMSSALALLNMAPVTYLDGGWACTSFIKLFFPRMDATKVEALTKWTGITTGILLVSNILLSWIAFT